MSDGRTLPTTWAATTLADVAELVSGAGFPERHQNRKNLPYPFFKVGNLAEVDSGQVLTESLHTIDEALAQELRARILPVNSIVFAKIGMAIRLNRRRLLGVPACIDNNTMAAIPAEGIAPRYLLRFLETVDLFELSQATTVPSIRKGDLEQISVPLAPSAEQDRIVAEFEQQFSRLDAGVAALKRVEANLKRYRAAVLKAACTGALTADWRAAHPDVEPASELLDRILRERRRRWEEAELARMTAKGKPPKDDRWKGRYEEPTAPQTQELPTLPEAWCWVSVEQLTPHDRAAAYGVLQPGPDFDDGVEFVRVCDVREGAVLRHQLKRISPKIAAEYPRTRLKGGEVLVTLVGTIGRSAVVPADLAGANTARAVGVIPIHASVHARFVELCFRNPEKVRELTGKSHEVARKTLNLEDIRATCVPFPPWAEQATIVEAVEDLMSIGQACEHAVERNGTRANRLRQSILRDAFEGKLADQDPTDEPASVLLERIRAEREVSASDGTASRNGHPRGRRRAASK